ncbi:hypothetical protein HaLaN_26957, partial [Haematococcus lacustris]
PAGSGRVFREGHPGLLLQRHGLPIAQVLQGGGAVDTRRVAALKFPPRAARCLLKGGKRREARKCMGACILPIGILVVYELKGILSIPMQYMSGGTWPQVPRGHSFSNMYINPIACKWPECNVSYGSMIEQRESSSATISVSHAQS